MADEVKSNLEQAIAAMDALAKERDQYHELYLEERITGLDAQIKLATLLREQAQQEREVLKK